MMEYSAANTVFRLGPHERTKYVRCTLERGLHSIRRHSGECNGRASCARVAPALVAHLEVLINIFLKTTEERNNIY
jgi:hypothetical protein